MGKLISSLFDFIKASVCFVLAFAFQFWWLYLLLLGIGAYKTAAVRWGILGGIGSVACAFLLPILTFCLWNMVLPDKDEKEKKSGPTSKSTDDNNKKKGEDGNKYGTHKYVYIKLLSGMMAKMAKADGRIDETEIQATEKMFERLGFTSLERQICIHSFRDAIIDSRTLVHFAKEMVDLGFSYEMRLLCYEMLWTIACADGCLASSEKEMLKGLEGWLNLMSGTFGRYYRQRVHQSERRQNREDNGGAYAYRQESLDDAYNELGCSGSASDDELRSTYRNLAKKLHPDVLRAQGLPDSLMAKANERMARINAAWDKIKKVRGIRT